MKVCSVCQRCFDDAVFSCIEHNDTELSSVRDGGPEMISGYRLERLVDHSRIVETYLAQHLESHRECLIKIFAGDSDRRKQFQRDAETAASLFDPNIADVYETGSLENGDLYLVTEQLSGRPLREIINEHGPIELLTAVTIIRQTAEAVHSLHLKGVIHRAIRPENIIVSEGNAVHLTNIDFGGLIEQSIVSDKFTIDSAVDVLQYFAPEQFSGKETTIKADVYSLGIVFYEILTGHPPFQAETAAALIEMHRMQRPADVKIDDFDLRMLITHTLMESLNKHPENRQSSANAFARHLRHVEQLATHVSTPPPAVSVPVRAAEVVVKPQPVPEINRHVDLKQTPVIETPIPRYLDAPVPPISHEAVAEHVAVPLESRLNQFRRRLKRHRHEHLIDSDPSKEVQIKDDIPEIAEVLPAVSSVEKVSTKIELQIPDDDLPSVDEVILAREQISEQPAENTMPAQTAKEQVTQEKEPNAPARHTQPPPVPAVKAAKSFVITNPRKLGLRDQLVSVGPTTAHHDPDEITAVTPRSKPIRISVERPKAQRSRSMARTALPDASADSMFFPALFGGSTAIGSDERSSMFAGFYGEMANRRSLVPRVIKVGGLVIAIASIVFIGKQFSGELRSEAAPVVNSSMHTISAPVQQPLAEVQNAPQRISETTSASLPITAEKISTEPTSVKKSIDEQPAKPRSSFSDEKASSNAETTRSRSSDESRKSKPAKADTAKTSSRSQPLTRTAKADSKPQSSSRTANKPIAQNKPGATTRPRIVANPRP